MNEGPNKIVLSPGIEGRRGAGDRARDDGSSPSAVSGVAGRVMASEEIFQGAREAFIQHNNEVYRLTITRNNKLILQK